MPNLSANLRLLTSRLPRGVGTVQRTVGNWSASVGFFVVSALALGCF
jgi:hypothetical protein